MSELKINTAWLNKLFHVFVSVQVTIQGAMWQSGKVAKKSLLCFTFLAALHCSLTNRC